MQMNSSLSLGVMALLAAIACLVPTVPARSFFRRDAPELESEAHHVISKRSFNKIGCLGFYDKADFARLDRICEDCHHLYRDSDIHPMCRRDCFTSDTFEKCAKALLIDLKEDKIQDMVDRLYGKE